MESIPDRANILEVAARSGVSRSTVSRVLNGHRYVSEEARVAVLTAMRELGYSPDQVARSLRQQRTMAIGAIIPDVANHSVANIIGAASATLAENGYFTIIAQRTAQYGDDVTLFNSLLDRRVDGIIWMVIDDTDIRVQQLIKQSPTPIVLVNRHLDDAPVDSVVADYYGALSEALEPLLLAGHRRIAIAPGPLTEWPSRERLRAYTDVLNRRGVPVDDELLVRVPDPASPSETSQAIHDVLKGSKPDVLIAGNSTIGMGAVAAVLRAGRSIPRGFTLVTVSDMDIAAMVEFPMSVLVPPLAPMGRTAAQMLLDRIRGAAPATGREVRLPVRLSAEGGR